MERIKRLIAELEQKQWLEQRELRNWDIKHTVYRLPGQYDNEAPYIDGNNYDLFPSVQGTTYFFRHTLTLPKEWQGGHVGLLFQSGGEGLLRVNGQSRQGLDRNHRFVTLAKGSRLLCGGDLVAEAESGQLDSERLATDSTFDQSLELEIELYDPIPEPVDPLNQQAVIQPPIRAIDSRLVLVNEAVRSLLYTIIIVRDSAKLLPETDMRRTRMLEALYRVMDGFMGLHEEVIEEGSAVSALEKELRNAIITIGGNAEGLIHMIGQSHIDIAWLWPMRETVRKTSRTFSTIHALMEEYPEFKYAQSQPLLFEFLKNNDPVLYEKVRALISEGRWELVGGMWVEPDLNIPSGESLMRQMLYGQHFYREEFGRTSAIEWLPDTFGYCASLPQILKHGGIAYFMTTKLGWNDTNRFPYDLFHWVGIDGTAMLSYLNHGVNENTLPDDVDTHWQSFREKSIHNEQMLLYGHGDGGGGVTREMLEYIERADLMIGQPTSKYSTAAEFFNGIEDAQPQLPKWEGDLYLELHRGTYTTHSRNKRNNRKAEILFREAEMWQAMALSHRDAQQVQTGAEQLRQGWKLILQNQFHDIIPGSAITEAYETSDKEYEEIFQYGYAVLNPAMAQLAADVKTGIPDALAQPYVVFNSLGWTRDILIEIPISKPSLDTNGKVIAYDENDQLPDASVQVIARVNGDTTVLVHVPHVPALGYKTIWISHSDVVASHAHLLPATPSLENSWETEFYHITFNECGEIISLFDKTVGREIVPKGKRANRFHFFHDRPTLWDAWDIDDRYELQPAGEATLLEKKLLASGNVRDVLLFRWAIGESEIVQELILYHHDRRIDFKTHVVWNEAHKLLKVGFPIEVVANKATYEIPFGALERSTHRNTSWEQAQYEVCGHRFVDVSEHGYGVSLLNDCKYGYDIQGSTVRLSLLRAPKWPDATADLGEHDFTYSLYPHEGDWRSAHTLRKATELNHNSYLVPYALSYATGATDVDQQTTVPVHPTSMLASTGAIASFTGKHVVMDTIKPAEDGKGIILRLYESVGGREKVSITWNQPLSSVWLSNALEDQLEPIEQGPAGEFELQFAPFEIKTVCLNW